MNDVLNAVKGKADIIILDFHAVSNRRKNCNGILFRWQRQRLCLEHIHMFKQQMKTGIRKRKTGDITVHRNDWTEKICNRNGCVSASLKRFETTLPEKYKLADGNCMLNGCIFEIK